MRTSLFALLFTALTLALGTPRASAVSFDAACRVTCVTETHTESFDQGMPREVETLKTAYIDFHSVTLQELDSLQDQNALCQKTFNPEARQKQIECVTTPASARNTDPTDYVLEQIIHAAAKDFALSKFDRASVQLELPFQYAKSKLENAFTLHASPLDDSVWDGFNTQVSRMVTQRGCMTIEGELDLLLQSGKTFRELATYLFEKCGTRIVNLNGSRYTDEDLERERLK